MQSKLRSYAFLLCMALGALACAHGGKSGEGETTTPDTGIASTKDVTYSDGTTTLKGFIAYPAVSGPRPAVLVVHEWWGLNDYVRSRAKQLADMGYVAFAVDMYGDGKSSEHPADAEKFMMEVMSNLDVGVARFKAAEDLLRKDPRVDPEKMGVIGYCFGGAIALHMARSGDENLDFVATFHANLASQKPMERGVYNGKILVATGDADPFVPPEQVKAFREEMDKAAAAYELDEYPGAKHGFTAPGATELGVKNNLPLAYDQKADEASWAKFVGLMDSLWTGPGT